MLRLPRDLPLGTYQLDFVLGGVFNPEFPDSTSIIQSIEITVEERELKVSVFSVTDDRVIVEVRGTEIANDCFLLYSDDLSGWLLAGQRVPQSLDPIYFPLNRSDLPSGDIGFFRVFIPERGE